ncbi:DUF2690 domain-containing protein [Allobranchiibius sp. CTAmp26]|uniref:DUF2690 domain-containing protein n=1 Tax=Allobranchiibius sp. CTAmp26 TaxID=2815214 RepID=UPI001AA19513|nr:DUF2690 domain-containing protein [Allobranchiibius sp. CTAmp26]
MRKMLTRIGLIGLLSVGLGSSWAAAAAHADTSAPSCYGASCTDKDPSTTNCVDDAVTIYERAAVTTGDAGANYGVLEMRYSRNCDSNWVRFTPWGPRLGVFAGSTVSGMPWIWRDGTSDWPRGYVNGSSGAGYDQTTWTAMVSAEGRTCMSVDIYQLSDPTRSHMGAFSGDLLGNYTAGCFS